MSPAAAKALSLSTDISTHSFLDAAKRAWILDDSSYLGRKEEGRRRKEEEEGGRKKEEETQPYTRHTHIRNGAADS